MTHGRGDDRLASPPAATASARYERRRRVRAAHRAGRSRARVRLDVRARFARGDVEELVRRRRTA